jgi:DNA helicase-2/ATP-dependent DNA helicase PcrA
MKILETLNPNQRAAALWDGGPLLVLAGPGSGKTATLTARVARLIDDSKNESFRILCLTFTRKAAAEMRERLLKICPDARGRTLLTTFHSFGTDILRQHGSHFGFSPDFEIIEESERVRAVKRLLASDPAFYSRIVSAEKGIVAIDYLFQTLVEDDHVPNLLKNPDAGQQLKKLFIDYKSYLKAENCVDYGAILYFCEELLRSRPRLSKQLRTVYRHICVDEFQDTNVAQFKLLLALAPERNANVFIVGDDDQVIYQWNGASPARITELSNHYDLSTIQLPENYRCPPAVVELANALILHNVDRSEGKRPLLPMKAADINTDTIRLIAASDEDDEASQVASAISVRLVSGAIAREVAVIARNSKLLQRVHKALAALSVPAHVQQRKSQFESAPMRFIVSALKLAAVRTDEELVASVTKALSDCVEADVSADEVIALAGQANGDHLAALALAVAAPRIGLPQELAQAIARLEANAFNEFLRACFSFFDVREQQTTDGSERFADYPTERQIWRGVLDELGGENEAYSMSLGQFLQELALANKTPEAPLSAVRCLTIHASKGMEFKHVYVVGLAEDQLPSFQAIKAGETSRDMQEERRNCFVAITRTMDSLTLSYASRYNGWKKAPSRFLKEMDISAV